MFYFHFVCAKVSVVCCIIKFFNPDLLIFLDKERPDLLIPYIHTLWNSLINLSNVSEKKLLLDTRKNNFDAGSYIFP